MKTKKLALILVVLAVLPPVMYVLAVSKDNEPSLSSSTYDMMGGMIDDKYTNYLMTSNKIFKIKIDGRCGNT